MGFFNIGSLLFVILMVLSSSEAKECGKCVYQSKVAFFSNPSALSSGACGYGSLALGFDGGNVAAAVPSIYKNGAGCGSCFRIKCKNPKLCSKQGTRVVVTDLNTSNQTDFVLSSNAFKAMANKAMGDTLLKQGLVDVDYRRVPCDYKNKNLAVRVEEISKKPDYLAIKFLYQGGQTEIVGADIATVGDANWNYVSRNYGAVWDTDRVPKGALQLRLRVTQGFDGLELWQDKAVLPADWKNGVVYDTGLKVTEIAQDGCYPC